MLILFKFGLEVRRSLSVGEKLKADRIVDIKMFVGTYTHFKFKQRNTMVTV